MFPSPFFLQMKVYMELRIFSVMTSLSSSIVIHVSWIQAKVVWEANPFIMRFVMSVLWYKRWNINWGTATKTQVDSNNEWSVAWSEDN